jgi:uncharacterized protein
LKHFVVTFTHPDEEGWRAQLMPHVHFLQDLLVTGELVASGPDADTAVKSAMLILKAPDRAAVEALIARDPFAIHGMIAGMTIHDWDPIFGVFNAGSSMPGKMQTR